MIFVHLWKQMASLLGLSVDDLEILSAFLEKGPGYRKIHMMLLFCTIRNGNKFVSTSVLVGHK